MDESSIRANPIQKRLMTEFCEKEFAAQVQHLTEFYGLENYHPQLTCNHSIRAAASYGGELIDGEPFVVLALKNIHILFPTLICLSQLKVFYQLCSALL